MTTEELASYYSNLLIIQYASSPKAVATVGGAVNPFLMDQLPSQILQAYNINPALGPIAVGAQLDVIGKYIGVSRVVNGPDGPVSLDDADFLTLMQFVIIRNTTNSSLGSIVDLLSQFFPGKVFISDSTVMAITYTLVESLGSSDLLYALVNGNYLPVPMGVGVSVNVIAVYTNPFFTFSTYSVLTNGSPFNTYANYQLTFPWINYEGT